MITPEQWAAAGRSLTDAELSDFLAEHGYPILARLLHPSSGRRPVRSCPDCSGLGGCSYGMCPP